MRKAFQSRYWIGAALQLGCVRMKGTTLGALEYVPPAVLRHFGRQFVQKAPRRYDVRHFSNFWPQRCSFCPNRLTTARVAGLDKTC